MQAGKTYTQAYKELTKKVKTYETYYQEPSNYEDSENPKGKDFKDLEDYQSKRTKR